ncbi:MAG: hypothetical protein AAGJ79_00230 [Verrucomicrobiota bacterium]
MNHLRLMLLLLSAPFVVSSEDQTSNYLSLSETGPSEFAGKTLWELGDIQKVVVQERASDSSSGQDALLSILIKKKNYRQR